MKEECDYHIAENKKLRDRIKSLENALDFVASYVMLENSNTALAATIYRVLKGDEEE